MLWRVGALLDSLNLERRVIMLSLWTVATYLKVLEVCFILCTTALSFDITLGTLDLEAVVAS